jgi:hypothetical protein
VKENVPVEQAVMKCEHPLLPCVQEELGELVGVGQEGLLALSVCGRAVRATFAPPAFATRCQPLSLRLPTDRRRTAPRAARSRRMGRVRLTGESQSRVVGEHVHLSSHPGGPCLAPYRSAASGLKRGTPGRQPWRTSTRRRRRRCPRWPPSRRSNRRRRCRSPSARPVTFRSLLWRAH